MTSTGTVVPPATEVGFKAALPAVLHLPGGDHACSAQNLDRSGVLLVGRFPPVADAEAGVSLRTAPGDLRLRVKGHVVFARYDDSGGAESRIALAFEDLTPADAAKLAALVDRVVEGVAPAALSTLTRNSSPEAIRAALEKITVAHRITLATRALPSDREWLRHDVEPAVLEALARNPNLVLPEIKTLLRRPDLLPTTLDWIANDPRWFGDEEVKLMICTHPRVSFPTADRVVLRLNDLAIDRLVRRSGLQPGMKQKLMHKLSLKHRGGG